MAIDIQLHTPLRPENLSSLDFNSHLHWPQGRRKPAIMTFEEDETKNDDPLMFELPAFLAERLQVYRNELAPAVIGRRPDKVFVTKEDKPRSQAAISIAIYKTIARYLGLKVTPHQFRHLAAKLELDISPGSHELVRELLGQKNIRSTRYYAGFNSLRAGRAHAELIRQLREFGLGRKRRRAKRPPKEE
jgi:integrase